jgi:hypothetical protein
MVPVFGISVLARTGVADAGRHPGDQVRCVSK